MPGDFMMGGSWMVFPIIGLALMVIFMFLMMGRRGSGMPWEGSRREYRRGSRSDRGSETELDSSLEILRRRYARGEITKDEFEEMKGDLSGGEGEGFPA